MMKPEKKKAAAILFTNGHSILLLKRAGEGDHIGKWALPGGKSKDHETEIENAIRETQEETGLKEIPGYQFDSLTTNNTQLQFTTFLYRINDLFNVKLSKEHSEWKWFDFDDLKDAELHPKFKEVLPDFLKKIRRKKQKFSEWMQITSLLKDIQSHE